MSGVCHGESCKFSFGYFAGIEATVLAVRSSVANVDHRVETVEKDISKLNHVVAQFLTDFHNHAQKVERFHEVGIAESRIVKYQQEIDRHFSHHEEVRRIAKGFIEGAHLDIVRLDSILTFAEEAVVKSPSYWIPPIILSMAAWLKKDQPLSERALHESIRRNRSLSSLFWGLVSYSSGRTDAGDQWIDYYLAQQNPHRMEKPAFALITIFGSGVAGKGFSTVINKWLKKWVQSFSGEPAFEKIQADYWNNFIQSSQTSLQQLEDYALLPNHVQEWGGITQALNGILSLKNAVQSFVSLKKKSGSSTDGLFAETVGKILDGLVFSMDHEEESLAGKKRFNELVTECNGDKEKAVFLFNQEISEKNRQIDFSSILRPDISNHSGSDAWAIVRMAMSIGTTWFVPAIKDGYSRYISDLPTKFSVTVNDWHGVLEKDDNADKLKESLADHLEKSFQESCSQLKPSRSLRVQQILGVILILPPIFDWKAIREFISFTSLIFEGKATAQIFSASEISIGIGVMINCCVWRGQEEMAYPDGRQDHQPFLKEWIRHGKEYRS